MNSNDMRMPLINNFTIGKTHLGIAVFAARPFKKGNILTQFTGPLLHRSSIPKKYKGTSDRYIQIEQDYFLGQSDHVDDLINHSCDPNAGLKFTEFGILLVAIKDISAGDEISWDYSTTMYNNPWKMKCMCGAKKCRGTIREFRFLPKKTQEIYKNLHILPRYIRIHMDTSREKSNTKTK